jgi:putative nucleotidyltransferase with HDIG domain
MAIRDALIDFALLDTFPVFEAARARLLEILEAGLGAPHIVAALEADPALALACVRFAKTASIADAVNVIPGPTLVAIAQSLPTADMVGSTSWGTVPVSFRQHALAVRLIVERLVELVGERDVDGWTTAALLHDVGKLAFAGGQISRDLGRDLEPEARRALERETFGHDHAAVGGELARAWELPPSLVDCIASHHVASDGPAGAVRMADLLVHYAHDAPIDLAVLAGIASELGLGRSELSDLLYVLAHPLPAPRATPGSSPLTPREVEILRLLASGLLAKQAAHELGLADSTIRNHLHRIYRRIGAADRAQAVLIATREGWL